MRILQQFLFYCSLGVFLMFLPQDAEGAAVNMKNVEESHLAIYSRYGLWYGRPYHYRPFHYYYPNSYRYYYYSPYRQYYSHGW